MKAIFIFKPQENIVEVYAHNLDDRLADSMTAEFYIQGMDAEAVEQNSYHTSSTSDCSQCKHMSDELLATRKPHKKGAPAPARTAPISGALGMVSAAVEEPKKRMSLPHLPVGRLLSVVVFVGVLWVGAAVLRGPQAGRLEDFLRGLVPSTPTALSQQALISLTPEPSITLPAATLTPTARPTSTRTPRPTQPPQASPTPAEILAPTQANSSGCLNALDITAADAGKTTCVTGIVERTLQNENAFFIYFSDDWDAFYVLSYDRAWEPAQPGVCVQLSGEIKLLSDIPVMTFGWRSDIAVCP